MGQQKDLFIFYKSIAAAAAAAAVILRCDESGVVSLTLHKVVIQNENLQLREARKLARQLACFMFSRSNQYISRQRPAGKKQGVRGRGGGEKGDGVSGKDIYKTNQKSKKK